MPWIGVRAPAAVGGLEDELFAAVVEGRMSGYPARPFADRLWEKVAVGDCWEWTGALTYGYGVIGIGGRTRRAHRVAYELLVGPILEGLTIDHLCRNRACVNPDHLEPVPHLENLRRGRHANQNTAKAVCLRGHEYQKRGGRRYCKTCRSESRRRLAPQHRADRAAYARLYRARVKEAAA